MERIKKTPFIITYITITLLIPLFIIFYIVIIDDKSDISRTLKDIMISYIPAVISSYALIFVTASERRNNAEDIKRERDYNNNLELQKNKQSIKPVIIVEKGQMKIQEGTHIVSNLGFIETFFYEEYLSDVSQFNFRNVFIIKSIANAAYIKTENISFFDSDGLVRGVECENEVIVVGPNNNFIFANDSTFFYSKDGEKIKDIIGYSIIYTDILGNKYHQTQFYKDSDCKNQFSDNEVE